MENLKKKFPKRRVLDNIVPVFQILIILAKAKDVIDYWTNIYKYPAWLLQPVFLMTIVDILIA